MEYGQLNIETEEVEVKTAKQCRVCKDHLAWLSHFATFPEEIPRKAILAACPPEICRQCGKAQERIVEPTGHINQREPAHVPFRSPTKVDSTGWATTTRATDQWTDCGCNGGWGPGVVLDPFGGSGTVGKVAQELGRRAVLVDLSEEYCELAIKRIRGVTLPMFT